MFPIQDCSRPGRFPFWVALIILANIVVFYFETASPNLDLFISQFAIIPFRINFSEITTLTPFVSSLFLHGGILHLAINMWFLWIFGDNVEARLGFLFPVFYLLSGIAGAYLQYSVSATSDIPNLGASGAVAGVMGAYLVLFPKNQIQTLIPIFIIGPIVDLPAALILIYWFFIQFFSGLGTAVFPIVLITGGVAYFAHIGGFLTGFLLGKFLSYFYIERPHPGGLLKGQLSKAVFP